MLYENRLYTFLRKKRKQDTPKVSIYMPTHRTSPQNKQDPIVFKNLVKQAEKELASKYSEELWKPIIEKLNEIQSDTVNFWQHTKEGLVIFVSAEELELFYLRQEQEEIVIVGTDYHVIPLIGSYQAAVPAYLVSLSRDSIDLYTIDQYSYERYETDSIKTSFYELYDDMDYRGENRVSNPSAGSPNMYHGLHTKSDMIEKDRDIYFRYLDKAFNLLVKETSSKILLAGTSENIAAFRKIAKGSFYLNYSINQPIQSLNDKAIKKELTKALTPTFDKEQEKVISRLNIAIRENKTTSIINEIEKMVDTGQVAELVINQLLISKGDQILDRALTKTIQMGSHVSVIGVSEEIISAPYTAILRK